MAEAEKLERRSALGGVVMPGRFGAHAADGTPGVIVEVLAVGWAVKVSGFERFGAPVAAALSAALGLEATNAPSVAHGETVSVIGLGPAQWMVLGRRRPAGEAARISDAVGALGAVTECAGGLVLVRLSGAKVRDALAKGCGLDLDPAIFSPAGAAATRMAHIDCAIWAAPGGGGGFEVAVPRSLAQSFFKWLTVSAAEFGYELADARSSSGTSGIV